MDVEDAAHRIGLEYPGGIEALAARMGKKAAVLRSKLNPQCETHGLMIRESVTLQALTGRRDIVIAMAEELDGMFVQLEDDGMPDTITKGLTRTVATFGKWMERIDESLADGQITTNEAKRLQRDLIKMIQRATKLNAALVKLSNPPRGKR